ncbi:MAG: glutamine synthetase family protein [Actinomycetes bacterium]
MNPTVRLEIADYDLGLRGKLERADKAAPGKRISFCTIVYGLSLKDEVTDTPLGSAANGYPDAFAVPDEDTRVTLPWRAAQEAVIADMVHADGSPVEECPRYQVRRLSAQYDEFGLEPVFGYEYEVYVTHDADSPLGSRPLGRTINGYSLSRLGESEALADTFCERMESVGIPVEMFHSEIGPGFFEFALAPAPALTAADWAARARQAFREIAAEQGLRATFMAKLYSTESGSGGHVHQSLRRDWRNVMSDQNQQLSAEGANYLGGILATMGDFGALYNPLVNSYKRLDPNLFVATRATWGGDNRNAACRTILNVPTEAARIECRRPGADASPYVVAAALLAGGIHGLRNHVDPGPPIAPGDDLASVGGDLPQDLAAAIAMLDGSTRARELLGEAFVACFLATRRAEQAAFDHWWRGTVTEWELARYPDHI